MSGKLASLFLLIALSVPARANDSEVSSLLIQIKAVGREGAGNVEASKAWQELVQFGPEVLPRILTSFNDADVTAANWLRAAVDTIAEREFLAGRTLIPAPWESFVRDTTHSAEARRLAYEWLVKIDPTAPERLLPGMLQDPSVELRRDAVARILKLAEPLMEKDSAAARDAYQTALSGARDPDQVDAIAKQLKKLDIEVDIATHFGFIRDWNLLGPFDSTAGAGFAAVYPPEKEVNLASTHQGKEEAELKWIPHASRDPYGVVDLNKAVGKHMGAAAYAFAEVLSPTDRPVQLRAASPNAIKIFLNGKQIFFREEYHHGNVMDQHVARGALKAGRNQILVKVCQNEQKDEWAQNWQFQLRICDDVGGGVPVSLASRSPQDSR